jgi:hypothetical protein
MALLLRGQILFESLDPESRLREKKFRLGGVMTALPCYWFQDAIRAKFD